MRKFLGLKSAATIEGGSTVVFSFGLLAIIAMMILPVPAVVLDFGLSVSFSLAFLIFVIILFINTPLEFSSFPSLLLAALVLRLTLNVSSTKLIISEGHNGIDAAGAVIGSFAQIIMGGSFLVGMVTFFVILIVNFIVITKGAARMAEVGARFALDGMPGKQLAIDSDISAGAIDHATAKVRRERDQQETSFLGSLDGVSKFVKGDAIAGLLITALNLVVGMANGVIGHGLSFGKAFETYAVLTVGDGLVTQIPAVIVSIGAALLLAKGGSSGSIDSMVFDQLGKHPAALMSVAVLLLIFAVMPGLPFVPFLIGALGLGAFAYRAQSRLSEQEAEVQDSVENDVTAKATLGDTLTLDEIHLQFSSDLIDLVLDPASGIDARISNMRSHIASSFGVIIPEIRLTDDTSLPVGTYVIRIQGIERARARIFPEKSLALLPNDASTVPAGVDVDEPVYGAPARWVDRAAQEDLVLKGITIVSPVEVLATHLLETIKQNFPTLFTYRSVNKLLDELVNLSDAQKADENRKFLDDMIPDRVPIDLLLSVLKLLLEERISIRNLPVILEAVADGKKYSAQPELITEHVRRRLSFQIVSDLKRADGSVPLIQLAPEWEDQFARYQVKSEPGSADIALPPEIFTRFTTAILTEAERASESGLIAPIVTTARRRRFVLKVVQAKGLNLPVISFEELGVEQNLSLFGTIAA